MIVIQSSTKTDDSSVLGFLRALFGTKAVEAGGAETWSRQQAAAAASLMPEQQQQQEVTSFKARTHHGSGQKETYNLKASQQTTSGSSTRTGFSRFRCCDIFHRFSIPEMTVNIVIVLLLYQI